MWIKDADRDPVLDCEPRLCSSRGRGCSFKTSLFVSTQYEIPFKLNIRTFHVSVMAITPAIASHKVRHPSS